MSEDYLSLKREISMLRTQLQGVESRSRQSWSYPIGSSPTSPQIYYLECGAGNLLFTASAVNYYGLLRPAAAVTEVPTLAPPTGLGAAPDGLSIGVLVSSTGATSNVWIGNRLTPGVWSGGSIVAGSFTYDDYAGALAASNTFISRSIVRVPVTGSVDVYANVYNPWRV